MSLEKKAAIMVVEDKREGGGCCDGRMKRKGVEVTDLRDGIWGKSCRKLLVMVEIC